MAQVRVNVDGWTKIFSASVSGLIGTAIGAGSVRETVAVVPAMWLAVFLLTGGKPTRVMTSDMLDGLEDSTVEAHDRRAKRYSRVTGTVIVLSIVLWVWKTS